MSEAKDLPSRTTLFVVGPTASGKTELAIALAEGLDGEIVNADSRQFYRGMDIGTAKPTRAEQARARHHLIDVADPDEVCGLAWFLDRAHAALLDIRTRGRTPILCGGTGQYVRALAEGWQVPRVPPNASLRAALSEQVEREGLDALYAELVTRDPGHAARVDRHNPRRVIRALEVLAAAPATNHAEPPPRVDAVMLGIAWPRDVLYDRIDRRVDAIFAAGLVEEVLALNTAGYACDLPAFSAIGYREVCDHLRGERTLDEAIARTKFATHRLARTQANWFRPGDPRIHWLEPDPDLAGRALAAIETARRSEGEGTPCSS